MVVKLFKIHLSYGDTCFFIDTLAEKVIHLKYRQVKLHFIKTVHTSAVAA